MNCRLRLPLGHCFIARSRTDRPRVLPGSRRHAFSAERRFAIVLHTTKWVDRAPYLMDSPVMSGNICVGLKVTYSRGHRVIGCKGDAHSGRLARFNSWVLHFLLGQLAHRPARRFLRRDGRRVPMLQADTHGEGFFPWQIPNPPRLWNRSRHRPMYVRSLWDSRAAARLDTFLFTAAATVLVTRAYWPRPAIRRSADPANCTSPTCSGAVC